MKPGTFELLSGNTDLLSDERVYTYVNQVAIYQTMVHVEARNSYREASELHQKVQQELQRARQGSE